MLSWINVILSTISIVPDRFYVKDIPIKEYNKSAYHLPSPIPWVTCSSLQYWQYLVVVGVCVYILPFFVVLLVGPSLLQSGRISISYFMLSFVFPLFFAGHMIFSFARMVHKSSHSVRTSDYISKSSRNNYRTSETAYKTCDSLTSFSLPH